MLIQGMIAVLAILAIGSNANTADHSGIVHDSDHADDTGGAGDSTRHPNGSNKPSFPEV
jgi:hypothetical protein